MKWKWHVYRVRFRFQRYWISLRRVVFKAHDRGPARVHGKITNLGWVEGTKIKSERSSCRVPEGFKHLHPSSRTLPPHHSHQFLFFFLSMGLFRALWNSLLILSSKVLTPRILIPSPSVSFFLLHAPGNKICIARSIREKTRASQCTCLAAEFYWSIVISPESKPTS